MIFFHPLGIFFLLTLLFQSTTLAEQTWVKAADIFSASECPKPLNKTLNSHVNCFR